MVFSVPSLGDFLPPTPQAYRLGTQIVGTLPLIHIFNMTPWRSKQPIGKFSPTKGWTINGRLGWALLPCVGPITAPYIAYMLPKTIFPPINDSTSVLGTGLPIQHETIFFLYELHYLERMLIRPLIGPSFSPVHISFVILTLPLHFLFASGLVGWLAYSPQARGNDTPMVSLLSLVGFVLWAIGFAGNFLAEGELWNMRRRKAEEEAKSAGRAEVTYNKVYVLPPARGYFKYVLYPHYSFEWIEWFGLWVLGVAYGLPSDYGSPTLKFLIGELLGMSPPAIDGVQWYKKKFGEAAVADRKALIPYLL